MALVSLQVTSGETGPADVIDCAHRSLVFSAPSFLAMHEISKTDDLAGGWHSAHCARRSGDYGRRITAGRMTVKDAQSGGQESSNPLQGAVLGAEPWGGVLRKGS